MAYDGLTTLRGFQALSQMRDGESERKLRAMQLIQLQRQIEEQNQMRDAAKQSVVNVPERQAPIVENGGPTASLYQAAGVASPQVAMPAHTEFDNAGYLNRMRQINPLEAQGYEAQQQDMAAKKQKAQLDIQKTFAEIAKTNAETREKAYSAMKAHTQAVGQAASAIVNAPDEQKPAVYQQTRAWALENGLIQQNEWPDQYTPEVLPRILAIQSQAIDADKLIDNQRQKLKDAEDARHNQATEQNTRRGQNMTDARSREQNQIAREAKVDSAKNADMNSLSSMSSDLDRLAAAATELKNHPGLGGITGKRGAIYNIPGSDAANAAAKLDTLKSQVAFGVLQNMRNNSKTGGALGNVSDKEGNLLQSNLAALDTKQSAAEFQAALDKIIKYTEDAKQRASAAVGRKYPNLLPNAPTTGGGITVKAPDGSLHSFETQAQADAFKRLAGIK